MGFNFGFNFGFAARQNSVPPSTPPVDLVEALDGVAGIGSIYDPRITASLHLSGSNINGIDDSLGSLDLTPDTTAAVLETVNGIPCLGTVTKPYWPGALKTMLDYWPLGVGFLSTEIKIVDWPGDIEWHRSGDGSSWGGILGKNTVGDNRVYGTAWNGAAVRTATKAALSAGWHHITYGVDGTRVVVFVDGVKATGETCVAMAFLAGRPRFYGYESNNDKHGGMVLGSTMNDTMAATLYAVFKSVNPNIP